MIYGKSKELVERKRKSVERDRSLRERREGDLRFITDEVNSSRYGHDQSRSVVGRLGPRSRQAFGARRATAKDKIFEELSKVRKPSRSTML